MTQTYHLILKFIFGVACLVFAACQAQPVRPLQSVAPPDNPNPQTEPLVDISFDGFNPETTVLRFSEGQTVTFELDTLRSTITHAALSQSSGPFVDFGDMSTGGITSDGDIADGDGVDDISFTLQDLEGQRTAVFPRNRRLTVEFVAPSVTTRTNLTLVFRSNNATQSRTRSIPIIIEDDAGAITLSGKVSKGLVSNTKVKLFSVDGFIDDFLSARQVVKPVQIDETGTYVFTLLPSIDFEELLLYKIEADEADMVCDAPQGCNQVALGETFKVKKDLDLRAYIRVPNLGTTQTVNVNILTTLTARSAQKIHEGFERVDGEDVDRAQREVADIFGLPNQDFTKVPFIDASRPITTFDENANRVAMIGGGVLGAAYAHSDPDDDKDYLEELDEFIKDFGDGSVACQDSPAQTTASIEDVMKYALDLAVINGNINTQNFFSSRLIGIRNGTIRCNFIPRDP